MPDIIQKLKDYKASKEGKDAYTKAIGSAVSFIEADVTQYIADALAYVGTGAKVNDLNALLKDPDKSAGALSELFGAPDEKTTSALRKAQKDFQALSKKLSEGIKGNAGLGNADLSQLDATEIKELIAGTKTLENVVTAVVGEIKDKKEPAEAEKEAALKISGFVGLAEITRPQVSDKYTSPENVDNSNRPSLPWQLRTVVSKQFNYLPIESIDKNNSIKYVTSISKDLVDQYDFSKSGTAPYELDILLAEQLKARNLPVKLETAYLEATPPNGVDRKKIQNQVVNSVYATLKGLNPKNEPLGVQELGPELVGTNGTGGFLYGVFIANGKIRTYDEIKTLAASSTDDKIATAAKQVITLLDVTEGEWIRKELAEAKKATTPNATFIKRLEDFQTAHGADNKYLLEEPASTRNAGTKTPPVNVVANTIGTNNAASVTSLNPGGDTEKLKPGAIVSYNDKGEALPNSSEYVYFTPESANAVSGNVPPVLGNNNPNSAMGKETVSLDGIVSSIKRHIVVKAQGNGEVTINAKAPVHLDLSGVAFRSYTPQDFVPAVGEVESGGPKKEMRIVTVTNLAVNSTLFEGTNDDKTPNGRKLKPSSYGAFSEGKGSFLANSLSGMDGYDLEIKEVVTEFKSDPDKKLLEGLKKGDYQIRELQYKGADGKIVTEPYEEGTSFKLIASEAKTKKYSFNIGANAEQKNLGTNADFSGTAIAIVKIDKERYQEFYIGEGGEIKTGTILVEQGKKKIAVENALGIKEDTEVTSFKEAPENKIVKQVMVIARKRGEDPATADQKITLFRAGQNGLTIQTSRNEKDNLKYSGFTLEAMKNAGLILDRTTEGTGQLNLRTYSVDVFEGKTVVTNKRQEHLEKDDKGTVVEIEKKNSDGTTIKVPKTSGDRIKTNIIGALTGPENPFQNILEGNPVPKVNVTGYAANTLAPEDSPAKVGNAFKAGEDLKGKTALVNDDKVAKFLNKENDKGIG